MSTPAGFLNAFSHALASISLYRDGHPARERAIDGAYEMLLRLQESGRVRFTFLREEIVFGDHPLRELKSWEWAERLSEAGIQRLEFETDVTRDDFDGFLEIVHARLNPGGLSSTEARQMRETRIHFGSVGLRGQQAVAATGPAPIDLRLDAEAEALNWLHEEVQTHHQLHLAEAETVVRSLSLAMQAERGLVLPLLQLRHYDEYTTTHALNVSVLTMGLAHYLGVGGRDVRGFGVAGLLHDIGKVTIPYEVLSKPGKLTEEERALMNRHPVEGARLIIEMQDQLELAAVVAYEHHIMINGGGYPELRFPRECHFASRLVHLCDVYDALRTRRPYRDAWPAEKVLSYIMEQAGTEFEPGLAQKFIEMMRVWEPRTAEADVVPIRTCLPAEPPAATASAG
ncbi:MAG TPA: HD domain-containing phosphohydrolase [Longimicrobiales bacterium]|nr:HD domain-containing phosphohydrolase [Longimicrobiales bacterium]